MKTTIYFCKLDTARDWMVCRESTYNLLKQDVTAGLKKYDGNEWIEEKIAQNP